MAICVHLRFHESMSQAGLLCKGALMSFEAGDKQRAWISCVHTPGSHKLWDPKYVLL